MKVIIYQYNMYNRFVDTDCCFKCVVFSVVQYSPTISTSPSPPHSPGKIQDNLNNTSLITGSGDETQVIGLSDGVIVTGGNNNRARGRGGRGGRGRGSTRGRRSTSAPPPELDHNLDVSIDTPLVKYIVYLFIYIL